MREELSQRRTDVFHAEEEGGVSSRPATRSQPALSVRPYVTSTLAFEYEFIHFAESCSGLGLTFKRVYVSQIHCVLAAKEKNNMFQ